MFVRAVWRSNRPLEASPSQLPVIFRISREIGIIGICATDFRQMTKSLFDR
jgi:hypothetical protein